MYLLTKEKALTIDPFWMDQGKTDSAVAEAHKLQAPSWLLPTSTTLSTLSLFGPFLTPRLWQLSNGKQNVQHVGVFTLVMTQFGIFHLSLKNKP